MWLWDPMTGERALLPDTGTRLKLHLEPTESRLLVFDKPVRGAATATADARLEGPAERRALHWNVTLNHYDGTVAELETDRLFDLGKEKRFESFSRPDRLPHDARRPSRRMRAHGIRRGKLRFGTLRQRRKGPVQYGTAATSTTSRSCSVRAKTS